MKNAQGARRSRGRSNNKPNTQGQRFGDGNRNDQRVRGNPSQQLEKYKSLARDAMGSGDRVMAEYYFQHADHFLRLVNERQGPRPQEQGSDGHDAAQDRGERSRKIRRGRDHQDNAQPEAQTPPAPATVAEPENAKDASPPQSSDTEAPKPRRRRKVDAAKVEVETSPDLFNGGDAAGQDETAEKPKTRVRRKKKVSEDAPAESV